MEDIEAIDLLSSDSDDSQSKDGFLQTLQEQNEDSFVSKRIQDVAQDHSTLLFEDNEIENLPTTMKTVSRTLPISKDLLDRKRVQQYANDEQETYDLKRANTNIVKGSSPVSTEIVSTVPSALNVVGVTEEEDKLNTSEVRHIIASYSTKEDCSNDSLDSVLSSNSMEPSSFHDSPLDHHDVELSEEDFSILQPYHGSSIGQPDHSTVQTGSSLQNPSLPISILSDDSGSVLSSFDKDFELTKSSPLNLPKSTTPSQTPSLIEKLGSISRHVVTSDSFDYSAIHADFSNSDSVHPPSTNGSQGNDYQLVDQYVQSITNPTSVELNYSKTEHSISDEEMNSYSQRVPHSLKTDECKNDHAKEEIILISSSSDNGDDSVNEGKINQSITISTISDSESDSDSDSDSDDIQQNHSLKQLLHSSSPQLDHESDSSSSQVSKPREKITIDHLDGFISSYIKGCSQSNQEQNDSLSSDESCSVEDSPLFKQPSSSLSDQPQATLPTNKVLSSSLQQYLCSSSISNQASSSTFPVNSLPMHSVHSHPDKAPPLQTSDDSNNQRITCSHPKDKGKQLMICFEERLANSEQGRKILEALRPLFIIGPSIHSPVHGAIIALRKNDSVLQYVLVKDGVIILMDGNAMIALIKEKGLKGALEYVNQMRDLLLSDSKQQLHLILTNVQNIISESRKKRRESIQVFTKSLLIELVIRLQLDCLISCYMCESEAASVEWITKILQSMRDIPFAQPLNEFGTVTKKRIAGAGTQDELNDHEAFLYRLLMCVPGVSSTKAMSVLHHYKSVGELVEAYKQQPSQEMKEDMLSDKLGGGSRQRQLSKRIYDSFSTTSDLVQL